jgi:hypothetical protein
MIGPPGSGKSMIAKRSSVASAVFAFKKTNQNPNSGQKRNCSRAEVDPRLF